MIQYLVYFQFLCESIVYAQVLLLFLLICLLFPCFEVQHWSWWFIFWHCQCRSCPTYTSHRQPSNLSSPLTQSLPPSHFQVCHHHCWGNAHTIDASLWCHLIRPPKLTTDSFYWKLTRRLSSPSFIANLINVFYSTPSCSAEAKWIRSLFQFQENKLSGGLRTGQCDRHKD